MAPIDTCPIPNPKSTHQKASRSASFSFLPILILTTLTVRAIAGDGNWEIATPLPNAVAGSSSAVLDGKFFVVSGTNTAATHAFDPVTGAWTPRASLPVVTPYAAAAVAGSRLHLFGGGAGGSTTAALWIYDPLSNLWSAGPSMPTPRNGMACDNIGSVLYAVGGQDSSFAAQKSLFLFDSNAGTWSAGPDMSVQRNGPVAAAIDGKLYVAGGSTGPNVTSSLEVFDPATQSWSPRAPMPFGLYAAGAVAVHGRLYVVGGVKAGSVPSSAVLVYDPDTDTWSTCASPCPTSHSFVTPRLLQNKLHIAGGGPNNSLVSTHETYVIPWSVAPFLPEALTAASSAVLDGKFFVVSGTNTAATHAFDPVTSAWTPRASLPVVTPYAAAAVAGNRLHLFGGGAGGSTTAALWIYDPLSNLWSAGPSMPTPRNGMACDNIGSVLYAVGGQDSSFAAQKSLFLFDSNAGTWSAGPDMSVQRNGPVAAAIDGKLYVAGGSTGPNVTSSLEVFDPATQSWSPRAPMPFGLYAAGAVAANGRLYVVGGVKAGSVPSSAVLVYDPDTDTWSTCASPCPTSHSFVTPRLLQNKIHIAGGGPNNALVSTHETYEIGCAGSAEAYGQGCAGSGGFTPVLHFSGCLEPGGLVQLAVAQSFGSTSAILFLGLDQASIPIGGGCALLVSPLLPISITLPVLGSGPGNGQISAALVLPTSTATPLSFCMQAFVIDPGVPRGYSATNGVIVIIDD